MLTPAAERGFTLIELLVAMTIVGILLGLGMPSMTTYMQNARINSAASNQYAGLQAARAEAIRRNILAQFVLTDTPVSNPNIANSAQPLNTGRNWLVRFLVDPAGPTYGLVESRAAKEGDQQSAAPAVVVAGASSLPAPSTGAIVPFNGFGATADGAAYTIDVTNPTGGLCVTAGGPMRCKQIRVSPGGQVSSCDPAAAPGDSRAC